jgi:leader peptidase (prepilin peptidase)/N-methyltransferase
VVVTLLFILGIVIGSFTNVLIDRLPVGKFFSNSRSYCESCKRILKWYDLFPLLSFVFLKGKCRCCHKNIPLRIPVVELISGMGYILIFLFTPDTLSMAVPFYLILYSVLIAIFFIDIQHQIIPDVLVIAIFIVTLLYHIVLGHNLVPYFITGIVAGFLFLLLFLSTRGRGMGFGDVKFSFVIGFALGFPAAVFAFYAAFVSGAVISLLLVLLYKLQFRGTKIAFGPFLIFGFVFAALFTDKVIAAWF